MQIVIDIPEELYRQVKDPCVEAGYIATECYNAIYRGKPLPKGHGRLIDAKAYEQDIRKHYFDNELVIRSTEIALSNAPTIIEADKESEGKE